MRQSVYHSHAIQAWEQRWFKQQNSALGLMQQVAWSMTQQLIAVLEKLQQRSVHPLRVAVCCGQGNNAGDGYYIAGYLQQYAQQQRQFPSSATQPTLHNLHIDIYAAALGDSSALIKAQQFAQQQQLNIVQGFAFQGQYDVYIDALFGIGLNRNLDAQWQSVIQSLNQCSGFKVAIDIPSGLDANTGQTWGDAVYADLTLTALALKAGLFTGQGKDYAGHVELISILALDEQIQPWAHLSPRHVYLAERKASGHKGSYGHVLVVGGHADMGGAVIMAAEAAFHAGAGKVTVACDAKHHSAILSRAPNIMLRDLNALDQPAIEAVLSHVDAICFGMGLGRDRWAEQQFQNWMPALLASNKQLVLDADALWFLPQFALTLSDHVYATPHPGEAATLLGCTTAQIEHNRLEAIQHLHQRYGGAWLLKGAGSVVLEQQQLWLCTVGNAGMGTGGMGDVLAGMIASLKAQFQANIALHQIVTLHGLAGDLLAQKGMRGIQAQSMVEAIYQVVNGHPSES